MASLSHTHTALEAAATRNPELAELRDRLANR